MSEEVLIEGIETPIKLTYNYKPGRATEQFLRGLKNGKIYGQRCPTCTNVIVPPRGACARCGVATEEEVELPDKGTVTTFTIVHIPIPGSEIKPPFVVASILLDGADISLMHLLDEIKVQDARMGMRVQAAWRPKEEWDYSLENIRHFKPIDEPDVDIVTLEREGQAENDRKMEAARNA
jgi:uncharacterized OB-fold protein